MKKILFFLLLSSPSTLLAQGVRHVNIAQGSVTLAGSSGFSGAVARILSGASVTVCNGSTLPVAGSICTGLASIFSDIALTQALSNPTTADTNGNYSFYATGGVPYVVSVSFTGFTTYSYVWSAPVSYSGAGPFTVLQTLNAGLTVSGNTNISGGTFTLGTGSLLILKENGTPTGASGFEYCEGDNVSHTILCSYNGGTAFPLTQTIASGTAALTTSTINSGACATVVTVSAPGVLTTDIITYVPNGNISGVTGYGATTGILTVYPFPTANNVNFGECNWTGTNYTPGAVTLNWRVVR